MRGQRAGLARRTVGVVAMTLAATALPLSSPASAAPAGAVAWDLSSELTPLDLGGVSGFQQDVVVMPDGTVAASYVLDQDANLNDGSLFVELREPGGDWVLDATLGSLPRIAPIEAPQLAATSDNRLGAIYRTPSDANSSVAKQDAMNVAVRSAGGVWQSTLLESDTAATDDCGYVNVGRLASSGTNLAAAWRCQFFNAGGTQTQNEIHAAVHDGATWSAVEVIPSAVALSNVVPLPSGAFAAYVLTTTGDAAISVRPDGGTWGAPITLFDPADGATATLIDVAAGPSGAITVTWFATGVGMQVRTRSAAGALSDVVTFGGGEFVRLAALPDGRFAAAWRTIQPGVGFRATASIRNVAGEWSTPTQVGESLSHNFATFVAADNLGNVSVAWTGSDGTDPRIRTATLPDGSSSWTPATNLSRPLDTTGVSPVLSGGPVFAAVWYDDPSASSSYPAYAAVGIGGEDGGTPPAPASVDYPRAAGVARVGQTLTCVSPEWNPWTTSETYAWYRDGNLMGTEIGETFTMKAGDLGSEVGCEVTAVNEGGSTTRESPVRTVAKGYAPVADIKPKVSGTPKPGRTLTCSTGTWSPTFTYTYARQWFRNGNKISGEKGKTYDVRRGDLGDRLLCRVTASRPAYLIGGANSKSVQIS